jgi:hypothetical protein
MVKPNTMINLYIWLAITIAIFGIVAYYRTQINKKTANVNNMTSIYNKKQLNYRQLQMTTLH